eukprot:Pgem_evm1s6309
MENLIDCLTPIEELKGLSSGEIDSLACAISKKENLKIELKECKKKAGFDLNILLENIGGFEIRFADSLKVIIQKFTSQSCEDLINEDGSIIESLQWKLSQTEDLFEQEVITKVLFTLAPCFRLVCYIQSHTQKHQNQTILSFTNSPFSLSRRLNYSLSDAIISSTPESNMKNWNKENLIPTINAFPRGGHEDSYIYNIKHPSVLYKKENQHLCKKIEVQKTLKNENSKSLGENNCFNETFHDTFNEILKIDPQNCKQSNEQIENDLFLNEIHSKKTLVTPFQDYPNVNKGFHNLHQTRKKSTITTTIDHNAVTGNEYYIAPKEKNDVVLKSHPLTDVQEKKEVALVLGEDAISTPVTSFHRNNQKAETTNKLNQRQPVRRGSLLKTLSQNLIYK